MSTETVQKWTHLCSIMAGKLAQASRASCLPLGNTANDTCLSTFSAQRNVHFSILNSFAAIGEIYFGLVTVNASYAALVLQSSPEHSHH